MSNITEKEEINRLKILNDIYINENERLKYEYRLLYDKYQLTLKEKENNSSTRRIEKIKNSFLYRGLRKIKRLVTRKK